jgi:hypothetical protein
MNNVIEDRLQLRARAPGFDHHINIDAMALAFSESIEPLRRLANLAYGYSGSIDGISRRRRRRDLERVGMRAVDLLTELASFVRNET